MLPDTLFGGDDDDAEMEEEVPPIPAVPEETRPDEAKPAALDEETATEKSELPA